MRERWGIQVGVSNECKSPVDYRAVWKLAYSHIQPKYGLSERELQKINQVDFIEDPGQQQNSSEEQIIS